MRALSVVAATASHVLRSSARARKASLAAPAVVVLLLAVGATPAAATLDDSGARGQTQATAQAPEFTLALDQGLVGNFAGYGAQLNQHVYAKISGPPPNLASLETKVITLEPQFVRIFFNTSEWTNPDRMDSFHRTVELARRAGAEVNITWQGSTFEFAMRNIARFARRARRSAADDRRPAVGDHVQRAEHDSADAP